MSRLPHVQDRVDQFAELLSQDIPVHEITRQMVLTKGQASAVMRRIREDLGPQADAERQFMCGHPRTEANSMGSRRPKCRQCSYAKARAERASTPREVLHAEYRVRILPTQLDRARHRLSHLEAEAQRLGMSDLLEAR